MVALLRRLQKMIFDFIERSAVLKLLRQNKVVNEATGSPILLTNSVEGNLIDFKAYGRSEQSQYKSKNVLNMDNLINSTELWIADAYYLTLYLEPNTEYTCSSNVPYSTQQNGNSIYFNGNSFAANGVYVDRPITITTNSEGHAFIGVVKGRTYTNDIVNGTYYIQIEKGSTATPYEPYAKSIPNPDNPQDINSIDDRHSVQIVTMGGLYNGELTQGYYSNTNNGILVSSAKSVSSKNPISCKEGDSVKLQYCGDNVVDVRILFYDTNGSYISGLKNEGGNITLVAPANATYYHFSVTTNESITPSTVKQILISVNGKYNNSNYIPLANSLKSVGESRDEMCSYNGVGGVLRRTLRKIFNGTEGWAYNSTYGSIYIPLSDIDINIKQSSKVLCSHFVQATSVRGEDYCISTGANVNLKNKDLTSLAEWTEWLSSNPVTVDFELVEPIFEPFADQTVLNEIKTYEGATYIEVTDNADMEVSYFSDKVLAKLYNEYDKQIKTLTDNQSVKSIYVDNNDKINVSQCGQVVEMYVNGNSLSEVDTCIKSIANTRFLPRGYVTAMCRYGTDTIDKIGLIEILENTFWLYDITGECLVASVYITTDYKVIFNATWIADRKSVG